VGFQKEIKVENPEIELPIPGFPDGKPCPRCIALWIIIISAIIIIGQLIGKEKNNE
jgi:hypothetical protein